MTGINFCSPTITKHNVSHSLPGLGSGSLGTVPVVGLIITSYLLGSHSCVGWNATPLHIADTQRPSYSKFCVHECI